MDAYFVVAGFPIRRWSRAPQGAPAPRLPHLRRERTLQGYAIISTRVQNWGTHRCSRADGNPQASRSAGPRYCKGRRSPNSKMGEPSWPGVCGTGRTRTTGGHEHARWDVCRSMSARTALLELSAGAQQPPVHAFMIPSSWVPSSSTFPSPKNYPKKTEKLFPAKKNVFRIDIEFFRIPPPLFFLPRTSCWLGFCSILGLFLTDRT